MSAHAHRYLTEEQYLAMERAAIEVRSEYYRGEVYAMAGTSHRHAIITTSLGRELGNATKDRSCLVSATDVRVRVRRDVLYTYPDLVVVCEPPQYVDNEFDTLLNPGLLIEVLSPSTETYDRGFKSAQYREIETLREYALVSQTEPRVEIYLRRGTGQWLFTEVTDLDGSCSFASLPATIPMREIYRNVTFDESPAPFPRRAE